MDDEAARDVDPVATEDPAVESLGPASEACATATAQIVGDVNYLVTYRQTSPTVGAFDLHERRVTDTVALPTGKGSWASAPLDGGRDFFIGAYGPARLFHVDPADLTITEAVDPGTDKIHCVEAVPGERTVVFGTKPAAIVYEYDHDAGTVRDYGQPVPGEKYVRSLAVTEETIYAGIGSHAHLVAIDRSSGDQSHLLPPELDGASYVRDVELTPSYVAVAASSGQFALLDREDPSAYEVHRLSDDPDPAGVHLLHHQAGTSRLFVADGEGMGRVFLYDLATGTVTEVASDRFGARELDTWGDHLVCTSDSRGVFAYDVADGPAELAFSTGYEAAGLPYRPEEVQSVAVGSSRIYVGGHRQTSIHDRQQGTTDRISHRGEPKAMTTVDGRIYQAVYPRAKIRRYSPDTGTYEELAAIGHRQNRPRSIAYHGPSGRLLVGTRPDYGVLGGVVATYDTDLDELVAVDRNVFPDQSVTAISSAGDAVYLGSEIYGGTGADRTTNGARIGAWDPVGRELEWSERLAGIDGVISLISHGGRLFGLTEAYSDMAEVSRPCLFAFDPATREFDRIATLDEARGGELICHQDAIVGVTTNQLFRHDPAAGRTSILLDDLDPEFDAWHNFPQVGVAEDGTLYVVDRRELVAVRTSH